MAHLRCDVFSDALGLNTSITVLLPQPTATQIGGGATAVAPAPPVLYLLHGLSDDDTTWMRRTAVERYAERCGLAVVMPQTHRGYYTDAAAGGRYWTWIADELPELVHRFFRVSDRRADTFVAGLSMGGYGALKLALRRPDRFAAAASMSGALDVAELCRRPPRPEDPQLFTRVFGEGGPGADDDLFALLAAADPTTLPALHLSCGTDDTLHDHSTRFAAAATARGVDVTTAWGPGGHEWAVWDTRIRDVLAWLPRP